jgi:hypothetical protein
MNQRVLSPSAASSSSDKPAFRAGAGAMAANGRGGLMR